MFRSRPVQYLGLFLLVAVSLLVIFFPVGPTPKEQAYTVYLTAPKPFADLVDKKTKPVDAADKALNEQFKTERLPGALAVASDDTKSATLQDFATTREEARDRAQRVVQALGKPFKGVTMGQQTEKEFDGFPVKPLFTIGRYAIFPVHQGTKGPVPAIKLGLDLQGGVNLVLQIRRALYAYEAEKPLPERVEDRDKLVTDIRDALAKVESTDLKRADVVIRPGSDNIIEVRTQAKDRDEFSQQKKAIDVALKSVGGFAFKPSGDPQFFDPRGDKKEGGSQTSQTSILAQTVEIVRARVDKLGVSEPVIQAQPPDRIIVQLPGVNDPQKAVEQVGRTAQLQIRLLAQNVTHDQDPSDPNNTLFFDDKGNQIKASEVARDDRPYSTPIIKGDDLKPTTSAGYERDRTPAIFFDLQSKAAQRFGVLTAQNVGRYMPIFLDERCISAPVIRSAITGGSGQISGGFADLKEAQDLANLLNSGALPAPLDVVENRTVSATLGADSLNQSLFAGLIGILAVMVFMIAFYRLPGLLANGALIIYCLLNLAAFIMMGATLTLPGIAGFLLALAMSLDTNILVFERLKEEMAIQPTFAAALRAAFSRAWTAILDSHVTTLIAASVLFYLGTGPVKGFALTLAVGVLLSLFSAISVTRLFMWTIVNTGEKNRGLFAASVPTKATMATQKQ